MAQKFVINKTIKTKIWDFYKLLKKNSIVVDKIILFGSHACGKAKAGSDIDLCLVSPMFSVNTESYFKKVWHLAVKIDSSLEPIPFTPEELADKYSTLSREIEGKGIRIV